MRSDTSHDRDGRHIRAQLIGSNIATACDITARGRTPLFTLCRALIKEGCDPASPLHAYRGMVRALTIASIGGGARLTVRETARSRRPSGCSTWMR